MAEQQYKTIEFTPANSKQARFMQSIKPFVLYSGAVNAGKAQPLDSKVLTNNGFKYMKDISIGEILISPSGGYSRVLQIHPQGKIPVFKILFQDGRIIECSENHLFYCWTSTQRKRRRLREAIEIFELYKKKGFRNKIIIPLTKPTQQEESKHYIDPYIIGVLLGDGCLKVSVSITSNDKEIINNVSRRLPPKAKINKLNSNKYQYNIIYKKFRGWGKAYNPIKEELERLNLFGCGSENKFIPEEYKKGTIKQRLDLIQGLMDTDGTVDKKGRCSFITKSERLFDDMRDIIWSLGGRTNKIIKYKKCNGRSFGPFYEMNINIADKKKLFKLIRKKDRARYFNNGINEIGNRIISIEYINPKECQCISINKKDGLYITDDYIVTHNSFVLCWKMFEITQVYPGARVLICRKEQASLTQSTLVTLFDKVIPKELIIARNDQKGEVTLKTSDPKYPSKIIWSGLDKKASQDYPTKIGSTEFLAIGIDEISEIDIGDFEMLSTRTRQLLPYMDQEQNNQIQRQIFGATNPEGPTHFLYKFFFKDKSDDREVILATIYDNPYASPSEIKKLESNLTGIRRERLLLGKWVQAEGVIYDTFDYERHVTKFDLTRSLDGYKEFIGGADSNFPVPRAGLIAGVTPDRHIHIIEEYYEPNSQPEDLGKWFQDWCERWDVNITVYHDPSDPSAIEKINSFSRVECVKAMNAVLPGISCVHKYFTQDMVLIDEKCVNLIQYIGAYRWKKGRTDMPEKVDDHLPDACRYMEFTYDNLENGAEIGMPAFI